MAAVITQEDCHYDDPAVVSQESCGLCHALLLPRLYLRNRSAANRPLIVSFRPIKILFFSLSGMVFVDRLFKF